jgi:Arc/MetJ-type ribon-helix-helix transcriptional regulator
MTKDNSVTVPVSAELDREIKSRIDYPGSKSEWVREAIRMRLDEFGEISDELAGPQPIVNRKDISTVMEDDLYDRLVGQLEYGEGGKARFAREAIRMRLKNEDPDPDIGKTIPERNDRETTAD